MLTEQTLHLCRLAGTLAAVAEMAIRQATEEWRKDYLTDAIEEANDEWQQAFPGNAPLIPAR